MVYGGQCYVSYKVKVICDAEELKQREIRRGDGDIENSEWQVKQELYPKDGYDITVDTSERSTEECASKIVDLFNRSSLR
jgi:chloramphenicol 3-O phosphotransferase